MKAKVIFLALATLASELAISNAQTTLSGDHVITGNLDVGTSANKGSLIVTGQSGGTAAPGIKVAGDGGVVFEGTYGVGQIPAVGAGVRMMWYPKRGAFRAGRTSYAPYASDANIGNDSTALGADSLASGTNSSALSGGSAYNTGSVALGDSSAEGAYSLAAAGGATEGDYSIALFAYSIGFGSVALANGASYANYSLSGSGGTTLETAVGSSAFSGGVTLGVDSTAIGRGSNASSYRSISVGSYGVVEGDSASSWVSTDPIFTVGNGTGLTTDALAIRYRNAFTVYKNGKIKMERQGDIMMGEFGNP